MLEKTLEKLKALQLEYKDARFEVSYLDKHGIREKKASATVPAVLGVVAVALLVIILI